VDDSVQRPEIDRWLKPLAIAAAVGMFIVLLMGATVTNTDSGEGCGRRWPLCGGEFGSREMLIESSHRLVTGVEGFLVLGVGIGLWRTRGKRTETRLLIAGMFGAILLQSGMGAWAVRSPQSATVMALHFGISLIAVTATALTVEMLYRPQYLKGQKLTWTPPKLFRYGMWFSIVAMYGIAYLGAYLRHSNSTLACSSWPDCNGEVIPKLSGEIGINFSHRVAAGLCMILIWGLFYWARSFRTQRPDIYRILQVSSIVIFAQALAGGLVVETRLSYISTILHGGLMGILFVALCLGCRMVLPVKETETAEQSAPRQSPAMATGD
jgi:cytochrome c oxidase assembly protein subunit 15